ncbi:MAG: hypothetical protein GKC03_09155 [Methanomassiliicoccales archaeon]|nr:hypothetical protein [Methanomassiliicoccales archaeon]NYT15483.1 hypothetical protein [Methanomassiliicoccales archaeon]
MKRRRETMAMRPLLRKAAVFCRWFLAQRGSCTVYVSIFLTAFIDKPFPIQVSKSISVTNCYKRSYDGTVPEILWIPPTFGDHRNPNIEGCLIV